MPWFFVAFLATLLLAVTSATGSELTLRFAPRWKQQALEIPAEVVNQFGQPLRVTRFAALISSVALHRWDGRVIRLDGQLGFIDAADRRLSVPLLNVPEGDYRGIEFEFGLPTGVNHADPGKWAAAHALNPLVNRLHWSWQGGYVFVALEGRWQQTASADASRESGFSYHVATDERRIPVRIAAEFRVDGATQLTFAVDLAKPLGAHRIASTDGSDSTHSAAGDELAAQMATAIQRAVFWLGAVRGRERELTEECPSERVAGGALCSEERASIDESRRKAGPTVAEPYAFIVPPGFPQPSLPADNPLTTEGIALGEMLFSDPRLAGNGAQSCASCHAMDRAFGDSVPLSRGAKGKLGQRNAMPLFNLAWATSFGWDGAQPRVRDQAQAAWTNPDEMDADPARVVAALASDDALVDRFGAAFGSREITSERITLALEQFLLTLVAADSKFDWAMRRETTLTEQEQRGFELFALEFDPVRGRKGADCFHCHGGILFSDYDFKNNGLERSDVDAGRAKVTGSDSDRGKFKTPSLRNVALTGPYMHDGRFGTLEEVVAHYDHGLERSRALDPNLAKHPAEGLGLSAEDQRALVAFLRTLSEARWVEPVRVAQAAQ